MQVGDFAPYGQFNPRPQAAPGGGGMQQPASPGVQPGGQGGMAQPNEAITNAVPQPGTPQWLEHVPKGLLEMFQLAPKLGGLGPAFLHKYGHQFENLEGAESLAGILEKQTGMTDLGLPAMAGPDAFGEAGGPPIEELSEWIEGDELDDLINEEAELGALAQSADHIYGGLY